MRMCVCVFYQNMCVYEWASYGNKCVYAYVCVCMCVYFLRIFVCVRTWVCVMRICVCLRTCVCVFVCYKNLCVNVPTCMCIMRICVYVWIRMCVCVFYSFLSSLERFNTCTVFTFFNLLLVLLLVWGFFTPTFAEGFSLEFEWQQVPSGLWDSSQYSDWS